MRKSPEALPPLPKPQSYAKAILSEVLTYRKEPNAEFLPPYHPLHPAES